jgi:hypothetical protein
MIAFLAVAQLGVCAVFWILPEVGRDTMSLANGHDGRPSISSHLDLCHRRKRSSALVASFGVHYPVCNLFLHGPQRVNFTNPILPLPAESIGL